jgi:hypothetical protein
MSTGIVRRGMLISFYAMTRLTLLAHLQLRSYGRLSSCRLVCTTRASCHTLTLPAVPPWTVHTRVRDLHRLVDIQRRNTTATKTLSVRPALT